MRFFLQLKRTKEGSLFKRAVFRNFRRIAKTALFALLVVFVYNFGAFSMVYSPSSQQYCAIDLPGILNSDTSNSFRALWCHECSADAMRTTTCNLTIDSNTGACSYGDIACKTGYENLVENNEYDAVCSAIPYRITYYSGLLDRDFDVNPNPSTYTVEDNVVFATPTVSCHTFKAWYTTETPSATSRITEIPVGTTGEKTLFASWTANVHSIKYACANSSNQTRTKYASCDAFVEIPTVSDLCSYAGYTPNGWSCKRTDNNEDVTNIFEGQGYVQSWDIDSDINCTAQWEPIRYNIIYKEEIDGVVRTISGLTPNNYTVDDLPIIDATATKPSDKTGYTFYGWCADREKQNCSENLQIEAPDPLGSVTLWADWRLTNYNITYDMDGGTNNAENRKTYTIKDTVSFAEPTKDGYVFMGWSLLTPAEVATALESLESIETEEEYIAAYNNIFITGWEPGAHNENIVVYAVWEPESYYIQYNLSSDVVWPEDSVHPYSYTTEDADIVISAPSRNGYEFTEWCDNNGVCATEYIIPSGSVGDIVLTPQWELLTYSIIYDKNGVNDAEWAGYDEHPSTYTVETAYTFIDELKRLGYTFNGWCDGNSVCDEPENPYILNHMFGNKHLYAQWAIDAYQIDYRLNGGSFENITPKTEYTVADEFVLPEPAKTGYTFMGWCSPYDNCDSPEKPKEIYTGTTGDIRVYAQWEPNVFNVNYRCDDGASVVSTDQVIYDSEYSFIDNAQTNLCEKTGYDLIEWHCEYKDENNNSVSVEPVDTAHWNITHNVNCSAVWQESSFTLSFRPNSGLGLGPNAASVEHSDEMADMTCSYSTGCVIPQSPYVYPNYDLVGWKSGDSNDATIYHSGDIINNKKGDIIMYAQWSVASIHCAAGTYLPKKSTSCEICPVGYYCPEGSWTYNAYQDQGNSSCKRLLFNGLTKSNATSDSGAQSAKDCYIPCTEKTGYVLDAEHNILHYNATSDECVYKATIVYSGNNSCRNQQQVYEFSQNGTVDLCVPTDNNNQEMDAFVGWTDNNGTTYTYFENVNVAGFTPENGIVTMTPVWDTYTLTYNCGVDNKTVAIADLDYGSNITLADYSVCDTPGYTFSGWMCDDVDGILRSGDTYVMPGKNVFCDAQISTNSYTIKFDKNAEDAQGTMEDKTLTYSETYRLDTNVYTRTGYEFSGWCDDIDNYSQTCTGRTYMNNQTVQGLVSENNGTITLYAMWSPIRYTINYTVPSGATFNASNPSYYYITTPTFTLNNPTLRGYNFVGWCDNDNNCSLTKTIEQGTVGNLTFTARMEAIQYNITYNYVDENANVIPLPNLEPSTYTVASSITLPAKSAVAIPGYTFIGWYTDPNLRFGPVQALVNSIGDINIYAKVSKLSCAVNEFTQNGFCVSCPANSHSSGGYTTECICNDNYEKQSDVCVAKEYTINYELNGGMIPDGANPNVYTVETPNTTLVNPTHETATFQGWYKTSNFSGGRVTSIPGNLTGNLTLYAKWQQILCGQNYYIKNGACVPCSTYSEHSHSNGGNITYCDCDNGYEKLFDTCVLKNYTIEYVLNGGSANGITNPTTYNINSSETVLNNPIKTNYVFAGWYGTPGFSGNRIISVPGELSGSDIILYAKWQEDLGTSVITYDCGNGNILRHTEHIGLEVAPADNSECQITDGVLSEWACDNNNTYSVSDKIVVPNMDMNCLAVIKDKYDIIYKAFDSDNREIDLGVLYPNTYTTGFGATLPTDVVVPGYEFGGWYMNKELYSRVYNISPNSTGTIILYAKLTPEIIHCAAGTYLPAGSLVCAICEENKYCVGGDYSYSSSISYGEQDCESAYPYSAPGTATANRCYKNCDERDFYTATGKQYRNGLGDCQYTPITYYIRYVLNGGVFDSSVQNPQPYNVTTPQITSFPIPTHQNKVFDKWTNANGMEITSVITRFGGDKTLYAQWKAKPCDENQYMVGETCVACPDGMHSEGGYTTECSCAKGYTKRDDSCEINMYRITYVGLEGATHTNPSTYTVEDAGLQFTAPTTREGYVFTGWTRNGLAFNRILSGSTGDITLTANWSKLSCNENEYIENNTCVPCGANSHSAGGQTSVCDCDDGYETLFDVCVPIQHNIDYVYNGGAMPNGITNPASYNTEMPITTLNNPIKQHYEFIGWYDNAEFTGNKITSINPETLAGNITLYAKWKFVCESGKWLRIGNDKLCLYSDKQTSPSMVIDMRGTPYYIMLSEDEGMPITNSSDKKMHVEYDGTTYNAHDASVN